MNEEPIHAFEPIPPWASGPANGEYMQLNAQLATRDGRRIGNAYVLHIDMQNGKPSAKIITDAGAPYSMTETELKEFFFPPVWVLSLPPQHHHIL